MSDRKSLGDMLRVAIEKGDFGKKAVTGAFMALGYSNLSIGAVERRWRSYLDLKKRYGSYARDIASFDFGSEPSDEVWVCWLQGFESAPELVKVCVARMQALFGEELVHIVTEDNLDDFVALPGCVMDKWHNGAITNTHFSDLLRNELLIEHGGLWLDSTVFLSGGLPSYVEDSPLFMYSHMNIDDITICYNNWLIKANKNDNTLRSLQAILMRYWEDNDRISDYFLWHLCLTLLLEQSGGAIEGILPVTDYLPESLALKMASPFDERQWEQLKALTPVHKLSNKFDLNAVRRPGTFYEALIGGDCLAV